MKKEFVYFLLVIILSGTVFAERDDSNFQFTCNSAEGSCSSDFSTLNQLTVYVTYSGSEAYEYCIAK